MQALKSGFGVLLALVPVVYCGGLIYYFLHGAGSIEDAKAIGLGPTLLGLTVVGLLFCIPVIVRIVWIIMAARSPGSGGRGGSSGSKHDGDNEGESDADAVVARYMARRPAEPTPNSAATTPAHQGGAPAARPTFGRRTK